jgi:hypothetical protein
MIFSPLIFQEVVKEWIKSPFHERVTSKALENGVIIYDILLDAEENSKFLYNEVSVYRSNFPGPQQFVITRFDCILKMIIPAVDLRNG